jgi:transposase-like protein
MMPRKIPPKVKAEAVRLVLKGVPPLTAQKQLKKKFGEHVSEGAIRNWVAAARAAELEAEDDAEDTPSVPVLAPVPEAPPADDDADTEISDDVYEQTRRMMRNSLRLAKQAEKDGNTSAAQKSQRDAANLGIILARLDKERRSTTDAVTFTRAELETAKRNMTDRVAALAADLERTGGLVCSNCGRAIRIALAKGEK